MNKERPSKESFREFFNRHPRKVIGAAALGALVGLTGLAAYKLSKKGGEKLMKPSVPVDNSTEEPAEASPRKWHYSKEGMLVTRVGAISVGLSLGVLIGTAILSQYGPEESSYGEAGDPNFCSEGGTDISELQQMVDGAIEESIQAEIRQFEQAIEGETDDPFLDASDIIPEAIGITFGDEKLYNEQYSTLMNEVSFEEAVASTATYLEEAYGMTLVVPEEEELSTTRRITSLSTDSRRTADTFLDLMSRLSVIPADFVDTLQLNGLIIRVVEKIDGRNGHDDANGSASYDEETKIATITLTVAGIENQTTLAHELGHTVDNVTRSQPKPTIDLCFQHLEPDWLTPDAREYHRERGDELEDLTVGGNYGLKSHSEEIAGGFSRIIIGDALYPTGQPYTVANAKFAVLYNRLYSIAPEMAAWYWFVNYETNTIDEVKQDHPEYLEVLEQSDNGQQPTA